MISFLQIFVSLIFFANKVFVLIDKKFGWLVGAIAAVLGTIYFFLIHLYCYAALDAGLIVLMGYGYLVKTQKNSKVENLLRLVITLAMVVLAYFSFAGSMSIIEFLSASGLLFGTYFLTHKKVITGWLIYTLAHVLGAIIGYHVNQIFFADFQIASAIVTLTGMVKSFKS